MTNSIEPVRFSQWMSSAPVMGWFFFNFPTRRARQLFRSIGRTSLPPKRPPPPPPPFPPANVSHPSIWLPSTQYELGCR